MHPLRQPPQNAAPTLCAGCKELCLLKLGGHEAVCVCPDNFVRNSSSQRCEPRCPEDSFACPRSLRCVPLTAHCDRVLDCPLGEDEDAASCAGRLYNCSEPRMFVCDGSRCLQPEAVCDERVDCNDASDEGAELCCGPDAISCETDPAARTRQCVRRVNVCDGVADCPSGADERNCSSTPSQSTNGTATTTQCGPLLFQCANGRCIPVCIFDCTQAFVPLFRVLFYNSVLHFSVDLF